MNSWETVTGVFYMVLILLGKKKNKTELFGLANLVPILCRPPNFLRLEKIETTMFSNNNAENSPPEESNPQSLAVNTLQQT